MVNKYTKKQKLGAESLIKDGLRLTQNHLLLLLYQDSFADAAECVKEVAEEKGIKVELKEFNRENFEQKALTSFLPSNITSLGIKPTGIALMMEWSESTTMSRLNLLKAYTNVSESWRIASMPGVRLNDLDLCISDFKEINEFSKIAFLFLARSSNAVLKTKNPRGGEDLLTIPLKKKYPPIISSGEISNGAWGNFPSGETFIVPDEFKADGWVTVRGSIPEYPLDNKEWIRFKLIKGRIRRDSIDSSSQELKSRFIELIYKNIKVKCKNSNALAELGIGTNPKITKLTGMPIFDEKKLGTVHIAFGKNTQFEGPLESCVHHDIVCTDCTLVIETTYLKHDLIKDGKFYKPDLDLLRISPKFKLVGEKVAKLKRGNSNFSYSEDNSPQFNFEYLTQRKQFLSFELAEGETAILAKKLMDSVGEKREVTIVDVIRTLKPKYNEDLCRTVIGGLIEFDILRRGI